MKQTIFIPTDFSTASLSLVEYALERAGDDEIEIVMTHCMFLTDSITELLFFDKDEIINSLIKPTFKTAFKTLCLRYQHVKVSFRWELFTGHNQSAFNNFIEGNQINEALIPQQYVRLNLMANCFDPRPYVRGSSLPITECPVFASALF